MKRGKNLGAGESGGGERAVAARQLDLPLLAAWAKRVRVLLLREPAEIRPRCRADGSTAGRRWLN